MINHPQLNHSPFKLLLNFKDSSDFLAVERYVQRISMFEEYGKISISEPLNKDINLWRYMDLHKLIDFISTSELHFTRLDRFIDPLEGVGVDSLQRRIFFDSDNSEEYNKKVEGHTFEDAKKLHKIIDPIDTETSQKKQFVNCWFKGERESIAMWDLYSDSNSMALKVEVKSFLSEIERNSPSFVKHYGNRMNIIGDSVKYLKLNPFDSNSEEESSVYSAFNKDVAFQHENEYRILISAIEEWIKDEEIDFFRMRINLNNIQATLVCHPLMEEWKKDNLNKLIAKSEVNLDIEDSKIQLRK